METPILRDKDIFPTNEVLESALGKRLAAVLTEFIETITSDTVGLVFEWRFYRDGNAWLGKATHKKKTIFWLSVYESDAHALGNSGNVEPFSPESRSASGRCLEKNKTHRTYFRTNFYFTEKTRAGVLDLNIDDKVKLDFAQTEMSGKMVRLAFLISRKKQVQDVLKVISYKKSLK